MNNTLKDSFIEIKLYTWKYARKDYSSEATSKDLRTMTVPELEKCLKHCDSMLYSPDPVHKGRVTVKEETEEQINKCLAELLLRSLKRPDFYSEISSLLNTPQYLTAFPPDKYSKIPVGDVIYVDEKFKNVPLNLLIGASLNNIGSLDNSHITLTLISSFGANISNEDAETYLHGQKTETELKYVLNIPETCEIKYNKKGLSYQELRAALTLKPIPFSNLSTNQLNVLVDRLFPKLLKDVNKHINFWTKKKEIIESLLNDKR